MNLETYDFKLGRFECVLFQDAVHAYDKPASILFTNAPRDQLTQVLREHEIEIEDWRQWVSPYVCLLVKTDTHNVLIDTGIGSTFPPGKGKFLQLLQSYAVTPEEIDIVLITHAHGDHCGGNTDSELNALFKNARYLMYKEEWNFWHGEETLIQPQHEWMRAVVEKNLSPIINQFELLETNIEVVPGVWVVKTPGHTPGHMIVQLSSEDEQLWYLSDAFLHPIHIQRPDWYGDVDIDPGQVVITRKWLLDKIMEERPLIQSFHFPFPGLGRISEDKRGMRWQPLPKL